MPCGKARTDRELNQQTVIRFRQENLCSSVWLMTWVALESGLNSHCDCGAPMA